MTKTVYRARSPATSAPTRWAGRLELTIRAWFPLAHRCSAAVAVGGGGCCRLCGTVWAEEEEAGRSRMMEVGLGEKTFFFFEFFVLERRSGDVGGGGG